MSTIDIKSAPRPNRVCGSCSLCCKLIGFAEFNKPMGQWCPHCLKGKGCNIYESRPNQCRSFNCEWLTNANIGDEWQPLRSKMIICHVRDGGMGKLAFHVDPGSPLSWRNEPHYSQLKRWARIGIEHNETLTIIIGKRVFLILADEDIDLGICDSDDEISAAIALHARGSQGSVGPSKKNPTWIRIVRRITAITVSG